MLETKADFQSAEEWAFRYRPLKHGRGADECVGGTLFDVEGEDFKFVARMDKEFVWSLFNNGHFDYIENGLNSGAIGYLVSDNPVRFAEISTKFAIGYDQIDWNAFERAQEDGHLAIEDDESSEGLNGGVGDFDVENETPESGTAEQLAEISGENVPFVEAESYPATPEGSAVRFDVGEGATDEASVSTEPVSVAETVSWSFESVPDLDTRKEDCETEEIIPAAEPVEGAPAEEGRSGSNQFPEAIASYPGDVMESVLPVDAESYESDPTKKAEVADDRFAGELPITEPEQIDAQPECEIVDSMPEEQAQGSASAGEYESAAQRNPQHAVEVVATIDGNEHAGIGTTPAGHNGEDGSGDDFSYAPVVPVWGEEGLPEQDTYETDGAVEAQYAPADQYGEHQWAEPAPLQPVGMRQIPIGREAALLDRETYGPWPESVTCTSCHGNGFYAGIQMSDIGCDKCDERGWNLAPGAPIEIPVYA